MIRIGIGVLSWEQRERLNGRYGTVFLKESPERDAPRVKMEQPAKGSYGRLMAVVQEARSSPHPGDTALRVKPITPNQDEVIVLGEGTVFYDNLYGEGWTVGLRPLSSSPMPWLNVESLYRAHQQTVELVFEPTLH